MITPKGKNPLTIEKGSAYKEYGATAFDAVDGTLSESIETSGSVNTKKIGQYNIIYRVQDKSHNIATATRIVNVVDTTKPVGTIQYSTKKLTNKPVVVKLRANEPIKILNNGGKSTYKFTKNGTFTFRFHDASGNIGTAKATVKWIDRKAPTGTLTYSTKKATYSPVTVKLKINERASVLNNGGKSTRRFTKNGSYTFVFKDVAGNIGRVTAKVTNIKKKQQPIVIKIRIGSKTITYRFTEKTFNKLSPSLQRYFRLYLRYQQFLQTGR